MKIFFDTEFYENGRTIELISIGLVREDGAEYYAETTRARMLCAESEWLSLNVYPHLIGESAVRYKPQMQADVVAFAGEAPEFWADYAAYDWVALCQIYGTMMQLPNGWPMSCRDIQQLMLISPHADTLKCRTSTHNALEDARDCKSLYDQLVRP